MRSSQKNWGGGMFMTMYFQYIKAIFIIVDFIMQWSWRNKAIIDDEFLIYLNIKDSYFPDITNNVCSHLMWKKTLFDYLREFCLSQLLIQISFPPQ